MTAPAAEAGISNFNSNSRAIAPAPQAQGINREAFVTPSQIRP
jgi:hypothetical protein